MVYSRIARGQGYDAEIHRRCVRWKREASTISMPHTEDASDSTREGHHCGVYQSARFQVRLFFLYFVCINVSFGSKHNT